MIEIMPSGRRRLEPIDPDEQKILADLEKVGVVVEFFSDLGYPNPAWAVAIPKLLLHLRSPYRDSLLEMIARTLGEQIAALPKDMRELYWPEIVAEYRKANPLRPDGRKSQLKDGLAVAVAQIGKKDHADEIIELCRDSSNGESRILLLSALRRKRSDDVRKAIAELKMDPVLTKEITAWETPGRY